MLNEKEIAVLREELETAKNPLFFYDDDGDGVCSFLLLYRMKREGKGVIVKSAPKLDARFLHKVEEYNPDKIFVLDVPMIEQDFIDGAKRPIFWIDHHGPYALERVKYFNPRLTDPSAYIPTSRMAYQVSGNKNDLWLAAIGCLYDWYMPDFIDEFIEKYPDLLPHRADLEEAVYKQPVGKLVRIISFLLKGPTHEVKNSIKVLSRIKEPQEILQQSTSQGKFLYKRFEKINEKYEELLGQAKKRATRSKLLLFYYLENKWSFTADLANELVNVYPNKVILIARKKGDEMKCSLRSKNNVRTALEKALVGIQGYGGGHENACGTVIKEESWDQFLKNLKEEIK